MGHTKKRKEPSPGHSLPPKVLSCLVCAEYEEASVKTGQDPTFDAEHVVFWEKHFPWAMGWDPYVDPHENVPEPPVPGDHVVMCNHRDFYPFDKPLSHDVSWKQLCGAGIVRATRGRGLAKDVLVEVRDWYHGATPHPARMWVPLYHVCQVPDPSRIITDAAEAWHFKGEPSLSRQFATAIYPPKTADPTFQKIWEETAKSE